MSSRTPVKCVLITGAAVRLGATLTRTFARAGWRVFCHYERSDAAALALAQEMKNDGWEVIPLQATLSSADGCQALLAQVQAHGTPLDCLINNAAAFEPDSAVDFAADAAAQQLQVNLLAPLLLAQGLAQQRKTSDENGAACVIHILDQKVFNLNPDYFSYTVSKLALERAVALQAQALAPKVRVCGVAPGLIYRSGPQTEENFALASRANLLQQAINPQDVADTCLFLAGNSGITGSTLCVDNGQHLVALPRDVMFVAQALLEKPE